jgi:ATP adenylyltransferase
MGINIGKAAGQIVNHVHIYMIPRYESDTVNPIGGVRRGISK